MKKLEINPADLSSITADYAAGDLAAQLILFGDRNDATLKKFGWSEMDATDGMVFKFDWN